MSSRLPSFSSNSLSCRFGYARAGGASLAGDKTLFTCSRPWAMLACLTKPMSGEFLILAGRPVLRLCPQGELQVAVEVVPVLGVAGPPRQVVDTVPDPPSPWSACRQSALSGWSTTCPSPGPTGARS